MSYRLGIDLGTTFTAAAVANGSPPSMVGLGNRALQVPSVLFLQQDGTFLIGEPAERRGMIEPSRLVREFKRRIGDPVPILVAGSPYSPQSLAAKMLRWVVDTTTERLGRPPNEVVLTHPANWGLYKLELLDQIVALANLPPARRYPEPQAAAAQYAAQNRVSFGDTIAVYDLGGGTFDACVLRKNAGGFQLLGTPEGVEHLGGVDFDEVLFQLVLRTIDDQLRQVDHDHPDVVVGLARLRRDCVDAKEALSSDVDVTVPVTLPGLATSVRLVRSEFESLIRPAVMETMAAMSRALASAAIKPSGLTAIVLVGGSSRIPLVGELLRREFAVTIALDTHPKHDVALGAVQLFGPVTTGSWQSAPTLTTGPSMAETAGTAAPSRPPRPDAEAVQAQNDEISPAISTSSAEPSESPVPGTIDSQPIPTARQRGTHPGTKRRRILMMMAGVAVTAFGVLAGYLVVVSGRLDKSSGSGGGASPALTTAAPSRSAATSLAPRPLPRSVALTDKQLIVPMQVNGNWDLYLADLGSDRPIRRLTSGAAAEYTPALSPDFATMIYLSDPDTSDEARTLKVAGAADGRDARELFDPIPPFCAGTMYRPAWRPDDPTKLAVPCKDAEGRFGLYIMRTDGSLIRKVKINEQRIDDPTFSPDGTQLAFWAGPLSGFDGGVLYTTDSEGINEPRVLTKAKVAGQDTDPAWSPDGRSIAFRRRVVDRTTGGNADVFVMPANGSGAPKRLTDDSADEQDPSWSRFGNLIVYKSAAPTKAWPGTPVPRAWIMNKDGTGKRVMWTKGTTGQQGAPIWSRR